MVPAAAMTRIFSPRLFLLLLSLLPLAAIAPAAAQPRAAASAPADTSQLTAAQARQVFCNVVDDPGLSSFQVPSIVDRSPLIVAISSSGVAPVLARRLRARIESLLDHALGPLADLAAR